MNYIAFEPLFDFKEQNLFNVVEGKGRIPSCRRRFRW